MTSRHCDIQDGGVIRTRQSASEHWEELDRDRVKTNNNRVATMQERFIKIVSHRYLKAMKPTIKKKKIARARPKPSLSFVVKPTDFICWVTSPPSEPETIRQLFMF